MVKPTLPITLLSTCIWWGACAAVFAGEHKSDLYFFKQMDVNGDQRVSVYEFGAQPKIFRRYDFNQDLSISLDELKRYQEGERADKPRMQTHTGVVYAVRSGEALCMDIARRADARIPAPVVIWIHGGGWNRGDRYKGEELLKPLLDRGFICATIEYRLSEQAVFPAQIQDCKAAVRFLRSHADTYGIDAGQIGVWGSSAGGHLAALLGTSGGIAELEGDGPWPGVSSRVQAVCDWYGPSDLFTVGQNPEDHRHAQLLGGEPMDVRRLALLASPVTHASEDDPPFLIMHGTEDTTVPIKQSQLLKGSLKRQGVSVQFEKVPGAGHGGRAFSKPEVLKKVVLFFERTLRPSTAQSE